MSLLSDDELAAIKSSDWPDFGLSAKETSRLLNHIAALGEKYAAATRFTEAYMAWVDEFHALPPTSTDFERIEIARDLMHDAEDAYRKASR